MVGHFYLYTNEGDDVLKQQYGGVWNDKLKRWRLPMNVADDVCAYIQSTIDADDGDDGEYDNSDDDAKSPRKPQVTVECEGDVCCVVTTNGGERCGGEATRDEATSGKVTRDEAAETNGGKSSKKSHHKKFRRAVSFDEPESESSSSSI